jgi:hypothetical protein
MTGRQFQHLNYPKKIQYTGSRSKHDDINKARTEAARSKRMLNVRKRESFRENEQGREKDNKTVSTKDNDDALMGASTSDSNEDEDNCEGQDHDREI